MKRWKKLVAPRLWRFSGTIVLAGALAVPPAAAAITLEQAVLIARDSDPWLAGSEYRQRAIEAMGNAAGSLPDPMLSLGLANLPTDTFEFDQEPMTQFKVGVSQTFPRGDSRALQRQRLSVLGASHPLQREDRRARVAVTVAHLWLEAWRAKETRRLIEQDRGLFEYLVDVAQSSYSSALGRTRQQDLVRAQLELTRLEDRLAQLQQHLDTSLFSLGEWLLPVTASFAPDGRSGEYAPPEDIDVAGALPEIPLLQPQLYERSRSPSPQEVAAFLADHPAIVSLDRQIDASEIGVDLAEQKYRPQWSVNASYGYRDDDPVAGDRADFFSVGVAFDLPLFTANRQDQQVRAAVASAEAMRTEKALAIRKMLAAFQAQRARLLRLNERQALYRSRLLREMQEQAEASLTAYTNDDGDFSEVVRARIAELNARIEALDIDVDRLKTISQLNYFLAGSGAGGAGG
jgi:outer membrane protein TolC